VVAAVFSVNMITSLVDKVASGSLALLMLGLLARQGFPLSDLVRNRLGTAEPALRV
jgi:hypothetical protein